jgi:hypothetical protein
MKTRKIICYTGILSRKNGKHSIRTFKKLTRKLYSNSRCKKMKKLQKIYPKTKEICPKRNNINSWVDFFGAEYTSPEKCDSIIKNNKLI